MLGRVPCFSSPRRIGRRSWRCSLPESPAAGALPAFPTAFLHQLGFNHFVPRQTWGVCRNLALRWGLCPAQCHPRPGQHQHPVILLLRRKKAALRYANWSKRVQDRNGFARRGLGRMESWNWPKNRWGGHYSFSCVASLWKLQEWRGVSPDDPAGFGRARFTISKVPLSLHSLTPQLQFLLSFIHFVRNSQLFLAGRTLLIFLLFLLTWSAG